MVDDLNLVILQRQALQAVMNGPDPDGDVDRMYVPDAYSREFYSIIVDQVLTVLAAHALSNTSAIDIYRDVMKVFEGGSSEPI